MVLVVVDFCYSDTIMVHVRPLIFKGSKQSETKLFFSSTSFLVFEFLLDLLYKCLRKHAARICLDILRQDVYLLFSLKEEVNVPVLIHKGEKNRGKHACIGLWKVKQIAPLLAVFQAHDTCLLDL